jgi:hypothetical protein
MNTDITKEQAEWLAAQANEKQLELNVDIVQPIPNPVQAGLDRTTSGWIGMP